MSRVTLAFLGLAMGLVLFQPQAADSACCYFSAKDKDVLQPAQKAFITWDPQEEIESFTVQPKFSGNAMDFGMVVPTPSQPKLAEMPRDFFKELAVFTILKKREFPHSSLLIPSRLRFAAPGPAGGGDGATVYKKSGAKSVRVLEAGVVGSLDYKIITAEKADDLYAWLKDNKYSYSGDTETLDFYIKKKWFFTVMKIDAMQMRRGGDGSYTGEVTPTRFQFSSKQLVYPLKITQISVKDQTEALFYVQAPYKVDLEGDNTYQYQWIPMLQNAQGWLPKGIFGDKSLPGKGEDWLQAAASRIPDLLKRGGDLGFNFVSGQRPRPNAQGRIATTLEWAKKLTEDDGRVMRNELAFGDVLPNVDAGFTFADLNGPKAAQVRKTIEDRLAKAKADKPFGYMVRSAPEPDVKQLRILVGHLQPGQFVTKFRKTFTKAEMTDDLILVPARLGEAVDSSEYEEILPTSPP